MEVVKGPDNIREEELLRLMAQYKNDLMRMALAFLKDEALAEAPCRKHFSKLITRCRRFGETAARKPG